MRDCDEREFDITLGNNRARICLGVVERGPYTTLLSLSQTEPAVQPWAATPSLTIRVYHDAKSAEVVEYQNQNRFHGSYDYPNMRMRQRDEKAQINRFLGEYLTLCLELGLAI